MKIKIILMMVCVLAFSSAVFAQKGGKGKPDNGKGGTALPAQQLLLMVALHCYFCSFGKWYY
jgi:hypothetical protein